VPVIRGGLWRARASICALVLPLVCLSAFLSPPGADAAAAPSTQSANLVANSSFEDSSDLGGPAEGWTVPNAPAGGANQPTAEKAHGGKFCHRITVPPEAEVTWHQVNQVIAGASVGNTFTLSAFLQTEDVRDGSGAYCSINCYDGADKRVGIFDAEAKLTGTVAEWRRQSVTATIPKETTRTVCILTLHGHGSAWFDDVQFEPGATATEYRQSLPDLQTARQAERERAEAQAFFRGTRVAPGGRGTVALFCDALPVDGCASSPELLGGWLKEAGYSVAYLNATQLANPFVLRGPLSPPGAGLPTFDLLVLPYGGSFPAPAGRALKNFLRHHGACFSTGGYAFDSQFVRYAKEDGTPRWVRPDEVPPPNTPTVAVLDFDSGLGEGWWPGSDSGGVAPVLTTAAGREGEGKSLQFSASPMHLWATATLGVAGKLPKDWAITRFWAKGDAKTPKLAIEWTEEDGSRWKTNVALTTEWKEYVLKLSDFWYWHDNPSVGRGGSDDHLHLEHADRLLLGVAVDIAAADQDHTFWLDDVCVQADPLASLRTPPPRLNTRYAPIRDAMWPTPDQVPLFDPSHRLEWVRSAKAAEGQFALAGVGALAGPFEGYAAVGMTSNQGHGFGPNLSRLIPLLDGLDRFGRYRGPLGSIMRTYAGYYTGASFAFFGVTNRDLFGAAAPKGKELFVSTVGHLLRSVYVHDTDTEFSGYRPGEAVRLRTQVSNFGRELAEVVVRLEALAQHGGKAAFTETRSLTLAPNTTESVTAEWKTPSDLSGGLSSVRATLLMAGKPIDQEDNAVVVWSDWSDKSDRSDRPLTKRGPYFAFGERPLFALGCQTYWGQNGSVTARSPLAFERDFAMMQDYGLHFSRAFIPFKTDGDRRQSDAIVQLAQQHRVLLYHTPNLTNTVVPSTLADEAEQAKTIGERYRGVRTNGVRSPWLTVDVCNEPQFGVEEPGAEAAFNEFLRERYGTTERLQQAWGDGSVELGAVKPTPLSDRWDDVRSADTHLFLATAQRRWATANRAALRSGDDTRLASVGFMQSYGGADRIWDPPLASADLDFTDRHYYGPFAGYPAQLKDIDLRVIGKPMVQGECGAKDHPTYTEKDPWGMGDTPEKFCRRFSYLVHHAFGLGAAALASWHWRDPMEGIFPCGLVHADRVPRPAASVMRALAFTLGRLRPRYETPQILLVVPENHRLGGSRVPATNALHRAEELLMSCQVDFGLLSENQLDKLPDSVRALLYPVPYCPSDKVVELLKQFVQRGGALYVSGDLSYDPQRKLTRQQRLPELAGVERVGERYPNIARNTGKPTQLSSAIGGLAGGEARPGIDVRVTDAEVLATDAGGHPVLTSRRLGTGSVLFCTDPVETATESLPWHRALYLEFLRRAGVARNAVQPDTPTLRCFRVPLEDRGEAFVLYNDTEAAVQATVRGVDPDKSPPVALTLAANSAGLAVFNSSGRLTTVEAQGAVLRGRTASVRGGKPLLAIAGHAVVQSLDDRDLASARRLLILPFPGTYGLPPAPAKPASVALPSLGAMRVELGELRRTRWTRLEGLKPAAGGTVSFDEEQALNMILAATPAEFAAAAKEVEAFARLD